MINGTLSLLLKTNAVLDKIPLLYNFTNCKLSEYLYKNVSTSSVYLD
jgi:hypothetical protein